MGTGCGCGCGGADTRQPAFVRPRFFAGQLLTEDDLGLLVDYMTAKSRLHNRSLSGPGVVCGLDVACDPCGGGTVVVHPGHALDCAGHDIVVTCAEQVDVRALVRELRVSSLGADCGDPCEADGSRGYGLFVRYEESQIEPVAPYATEEPCGSTGCVPSRIQEGFRFVVRHGADAEDHRHNPGARLLAILGDLDRADRARARDRRLGLHTDAVFAALLAPERAFRFDAADARRYTDALAWLRANSGGDGALPATTARRMTEYVRALAAAVARFDTYDRAGQSGLIRDYPDLGSVQDARGTLGAACDRLAGTDMEAVWPDPLHRSIARAVVTETKARLMTGQGEKDTPLEVRLLAQGTPLSHALRVEFRADLTLIRDWLLARLDQTDALADCALRAEIAAIGTPLPLPPPEPLSVEPTTAVELRQIAEAAAALTAAVRRFVTDAACSTLSPPCVDCSDTDVLLAHVRFDGCDVVRICSATREQVLPGGSAYGEWLPKLYQLRELAERLCCQPVPRYQQPAIPAEGPVPRPYAEGLLDDWPRTGDLEEMLSLLLTPAPGETPPEALREETRTAPADVTDSLEELAELRTRLSDLTAAVEGLRAQLGSAPGERPPEGGNPPAQQRPPEGEDPPAQQRPTPAKPPARRPRSRAPKPGETT
ncbi:hypothetical protein [Streptomyces jumonjinensis]|uniref:Uncharacterized protein n=1 Tax=Streptomyces jumonjinensis TaxID=1945 RepID=A0A646KEC0_STRJU|nr:hypothetical protein [Streptomyces jumonjinensis]MQT00573.1 hypothetical protein [Streptomyces jumonjinensis]